MAISPREHYNARLVHWSATADALLQRESLFTRIRLVLGLVIVAAGFSAFGWHALHPAVFVLLLFALVPVVITHESVVRRRQAALRAHNFFQQALSRLDGKWAGSGVTGDQFRSPHHVYSEDLDVFGRGSLFELLCTARTAAGQSTLARWLAAPADRAIALARQTAVRELTPRAQLREDLALLGEEVRARLHPEQLQAWADAPPVNFPAAARYAAPVLAALGAATFFLWLFSQIPLTGFLIVFLLTGALHLSLRDRVEHVAHSLDAPSRELGLIAALLHRLETEPFESPLLRERVPHAAAPIRELQGLIERVDWAHNLGFAPVAWVLLWTPQHAFAIERWRARHGREVAQWLDALATFEALASLSNYAFEHPSATFPELLEAQGVWDATDLAHPLLPEKTAVANSLRIDPTHRLWIVSGSNMSGKSTFLRSIGLNTILAWTGAPVRASRLTLSPFSLGAAIRTVDSLLEGHSRFFAEITRLRQVVDLTAQPLPVLFLLDELLSGTNSHDRRLGAQAIIRGLLERGGYGLVTTHDLALTAIVSDLPGAGNVHFEDHLDAGQIRFDYRLRPGVVERSNALELMRSIGLLPSST